MKHDTSKGRQQYIIDLELLNTHNARGCAACGQKFNLGDTAVVACGEWTDGPRLIHASEAVYDNQSDAYFERRCYEGMRNSGPVS